MARAYVAARAPRLAGSCANRFSPMPCGVLDHHRPQAAVRPGFAGGAPIAGGSDRRGRTHGLGPDRPAGRAWRTRFWWPISRPRRGRQAGRAAAAQSYVAQLALYRMLLAEIYPGKRIRTFLVWTVSGPVIRELMEPELESALTLIKAA